MWSSRLKKKGWAATYLVKYHDRFDIFSGGHCNLTDHQMELLLLLQMLMRAVGVRDRRHRPDCPGSATPLSLC